MQIVVPAGMFGPSEYDTPIDAAMRVIALAVDADPLEWAEKYGANVDNDVFMMHRYCWCEESDCAWCEWEDGAEYGAPNFWHKASGFKVWWYKYIGRDVETEGEPPADLIEQCVTFLASSLGVEA